MTEKRFTITGHRSVSDHQKKRLYDLNDFDGIISVTETMNELSEENKQLEKENEQLQSEVSKLTDLIASEIEKNAKLLQENNSLKIENMRFKEEIKDWNDVLTRLKKRS